MAKTVKLLLTENVDNLGIVGDIVNVGTPLGGLPTCGVACAG